MNILVVDDSRAMRMILKRMLRDAGFDAHDIIEADDGVKALEAIKTNTPDIVMSDWNVPNLNGIDLLKALNEEGIVTKFGFITAEGTEDMRRRAMNAGAQFMISTPFTNESLQSALQPLLQA